MIFRKTTLTDLYVHLKLLQTSNLLTYENINRHNFCNILWFSDHLLQRIRQESWEDMSLTTLYPALFLLKAITWKQKAHMPEKHWSIPSYT